MGVVVEFVLKVSEYPTFNDVNDFWKENDGSFDSKLMRTTLIAQNGYIPIHLSTSEFLSKTGAKDYIVNQRKNVAHVVKFLGSYDLYENDPNHPKILAFFKKVKKINEQVVLNVKKEEISLKKKKFVTCPHCNSKINTNFLVESEQYKWGSHNIPFVEYNFDKYLAREYSLPDDHWCGLEEKISEINKSCPVCVKGNLLTTSFLTKIGKQKEKLNKLIEDYYKLRTSSDKKEEYWLVYGVFS